jgi:hypothetical protein
MANIGTYLESIGATYEPIERLELHRLVNRWLKSFCVPVFDRTGKWVYKSFKWHAFSFEFVHAVSGTKALDVYQRHPLKEYILFNDDESWAFKCSGGSHPNLHEDAYLVPLDFKWTMAFTHEQPNIGPFYADNGT